MTIRWVLEAALSVTIVIAAFVALLWSLLESAIAFEPVTHLLALTLVLGAVLLKGLFFSKLADGSNVNLSRFLSVHMRSNLVAIFAPNFLSTVLRLKRYSSDIGAAKSLKILVFDKFSDLFVWSFLGLVFILMSSLNVENVQFFWVLIGVFVVVIMLSMAAMVRTNGIFELPVTKNLVQKLSSEGQNVDLPARNRLRSIPISCASALLGSLAIFAIASTSMESEMFPEIMIARALSTIVTVIPLPLPATIVRDGSFLGLLFIVGFGASESIYLASTMYLLQASASFFGILPESSLWWKRVQEARSKSKCA